MREVIRRPTGDGVLDAMLELLAPAFDPLPRFSAEIGSRTPPLLKTPCGRRTAAPLLFEFGLPWQPAFGNFREYWMAGNLHDVKNELAGFPWIRQDSPAFVEQESRQHEAG